MTDPAPPTVAGRLRGARRRGFVGRVAEVELFAEAIRAPEPPFCVLWVHGPGGVGKTALLDAFATVAETAGRTPVRLDLRTIEPSPPVFAAALAERRAPGDGPLLALLDTFEAAAALEDWLRDELIPAQPAGSLVVIAGRGAPAEGWRRDPGWRDLLRVVSLRNLDPEEAHALLARAGVDPALHARALALTHGHPLALSLLVDVIAQRGGELDPDTLDLGAVPDVLEPLLSSFLAGVPSARHRLAVEAAAQARSTTVALLHDALEGDDADALFGWLRSVSFMEAGARGLFPHDLARDVIAADLRWRDPVAHERLHRRVHRHVVARVRATHGLEHQQAVADLIFLHRGNPVASAFWDWQTLGHVYGDALAPGDADAILAMIERHEGPESAAIAAHWLARQPEGFVPFRGRGAAPVGFMAQIALERASEDDLARDPGARAIWLDARRHGAGGPGEEVLAGRWFMDRDAYQRPSPSFNVVTMRTLQEWVGRPALAWYALAWHDAEAGAPMMRYIDFRRAPEADFSVGDRRYAVFARDWRRGGAGRWLEVMADRELGAEAPAPAAASPLALSQPDFAAAVRRALRDLHRPAALAANPLLRTRLLEGGDAGGLAAIVREAVGELRDEPRDERLFRALDRTYLRPAPTQEAAAELLGLPFSTYRGHLTRGVERVVERLWQRELAGA